MSEKKTRKVKMGSSRRRPRNQDENETKKEDDGSEMLSEQRKGVGADSVSLTIQTDLFSSDYFSSITPQFMEDVNPSLNNLTESQLSQPGNPYLLESPDTAGKRKKMGSTRRNKGKQEETDFGEKQHAETGDTQTSLELQASIAVVEFESHNNTEELLGPKEIEMDTKSRSQSEFILIASNTLDQSDDRCKAEVGEDTEPSSEAVASYSSELLQDTAGTESHSHLSLQIALQAVRGFTTEPIAEEWKKPEERRQKSEHAEAESSTFHSSRHSSDQFLESDASTITEEFESFNNTIILQSGEGEEKPALNESEVQDDINFIRPTLEKSLLLEPEHRADEKKGEDDVLIEPTPFDHVIYSFGIEDQLYNKEKGNRASVFIETGNIETESNSEGSMAHIVDPLEVFIVGLEQSGDTLLGEEEVSDYTLLVNDSEVSDRSQIIYDRALTIESDDTLSTDSNISPSQLIHTPCAEITNPFLNPILLQRIQGNANTDSNTTGGLDTSVILLSEEEVSDHVLLVNQSVQDQGDNAANTDSNQSPFPGRRRKMGSTRRHPVQREEGTKEKPEEEIKKTEAIEGKGEEFEMLMESKDRAGKDENVLTDLSCSSSTLNQEGRIDGDEIEKSYLTDDTLNSNPAISGLQHEETSLAVTLCESRENTDSPPDPSSLQSSLGLKETADVEPITPRRKRKMGSTRRTPRGSQGVERTEERQEEEKEKYTEVIGDVGAVMRAVEMESSIEKTELEELIETVTVEQATGDPETIVVEEESALEKSELVEPNNVRDAEEVVVKIVAESESSQTPYGTAAQESGDMVCIDPHRLTKTAHMEQRLSSPSPSLPSKSSLSLSSQSHKDVGQSKATGKRRKMGSTRQTRGGLHSEEEKQGTGEEVRGEAIGDLEVSAISERFQEERMAEAVSLEDQQERQSTEKEAIFIEVVPSSTALRGGGSEQVAPAPQPGPGNKRGQEKAERVEKSPVTREKEPPSGTLGSSGSRSNPYNVVMVGNSSVGKTSFMKRFQSGEFCNDHYATIGIDTCIQPVTVDGSPVTLQLWDTAGQERYHSITRQVFHRAQGLVLMYDITSSQSFCDVRYWVNCIQEGAPDDVIIILLGNKADCANLEREVQTHEGENLAKGYGMLFMECSAATGDNVTLSMETLARMLKQLGEETRQEEGSLVLQKEPPKKKLGCC
ncbi:hypothetical protein J4Q44_G00106610 [Coregonus suidteri]|uniref:Uncharacterized protein n=1 Tax=Coregonus suidteri TaxID=861788 RepID=A0AAN8M7S3_9TELE